MSCGACNQEYNPFVYLNDQDAKDNTVEVTITNGVDGDFYFELITEDYHRQTIKPINYCPMCGRSVREDKVPFSTTEIGGLN